MRIGTVCFHTAFPFNDTDQPGQKLFVVLNNGAVGYYLVAKTTSKGHRFINTYGCAPDGARFPAYFLPSATNTFRMNTWIELNEFFEFSQSYVVNGGLKGTILPKFVLPGLFICPLIACAMESPDLARKFKPLLQQSLSVLQCPE
ncbi:MAG: hypothetical protein HQL56_16885 [Magnetococcales bacterium]|nr:hypothetical protein [Magnetococcales bacterium]